MTKSQGGSSFNERTCPMSIATQRVEALSPEAFASPKRSRFPCAPRYRRNSVPPDGRGPQAARHACALLRDFTLTSFPVSWPTRSCFYPQSFTAEPAETRFSCQGATRVFFSGWIQPESPVPLPQKDSPSSPRIHVRAFWLGKVSLPPTGKSWLIPLFTKISDTSLACKLFPTEHANHPQAELGTCEPFVRVKATRVTMM